MAPPPAANQQRDSSVVFAQARQQVVVLVNALSRKNESASFQLVRQLERQFGTALYVHFLSTLIDSIQVDRLGGAAPEDRDLFRAKALGRELERLLEKPAGAQCIAQVVRGPRVKHFAELAERFSVLGVTSVSVAVLGSALSRSDQQDAAALGDQLVSQHTSAAIKSLLSDPLPPQAIAVHFLNLYSAKAELFPALEQIASRLAAATNNPPVTLLPFLSSNDTAMLPGRNSLMGLRDDLMGSLGSDAPPATLASSMRQAGFRCCATPEALTQLFKLHNFGPKNPPRSSDVAAVLAMMMQPAGGQDDGLFMSVYSSDGKHDREDAANSWNVANFVSVVRSLNVDPNDVFRSLDRADFFVADHKAFELLQRAFAAFGMPKFAPAQLLNRWSHTDAQLSLLAACINYLPEVFVGPPMRQVVVDFDGVDTKPFPSSLMHPAFACVELIALLVAISETTSGNLAKVTSILDVGASKCPELLLLSLAQVDEYLRSAHVREHYFTTVLPVFFQPSNANAGILLPRLWHIAKDVVVIGMVEAYRRDAHSLSRLLDIAFELKGIMTILESKVPPVFTVDFAVLASRREYLNLEKWLQDQLAQQQVQFFRVCLDFLEVRGQLPDSGVPMTAESLSVIIKMLYSQAEAVPGDYAARLRHLHAGCVQAHQRLATMLPEPAGGAVNESSRGTFLPEVEADSSSYFKRVFNDMMSIDEVVATLRRFKTSNSAHERDVFACMIHSLFDEYRFFPKYPEKELMITGKMFGALIENQLVTYGPLAITLRYVLDALRKPAGSKMFKFGVEALLQFRSRLGEWPQYCSHIVQIPHLKETHPEIISYIEALLAQAENRGGAMPDSTSPSLGGVDAPGSPGSAPSSMEGEDRADAGNERNPLLALGAPSVQPVSDQVEERIAFLFNNVSPSNVESSAKNIIAAVTPAGYDWLAHYMVVVRVVSEPNLHSLFVQLVEAMKCPELEAALLSETYRNIRNVLASEKATNGNLRTILKTLGTWLGLMTVARDRPILHVNLSLKDILLQAYDQNTLVAAIPFVCQVMGQVHRSKIFKPPNPWTMGILKLLAEIHQSADIRLNLKFEYEVVLKELKMEPRDVEPSTLLKYRHRQAQEERPRVSDVAGQPIIFPPELRGVQRLIQNAMEAAAVEIAQAVVDRSVKIACITTRELILKDFAMEPDEQKMRKMAQMMASNLAMSLALVACKDPLRLSLTTHLRNLAHNGSMDPQTLESALGAVLQDSNLDFLSKYIESQAQERAITEIDQDLLHAFTNRKKYREKTGSNYYDMSIYTAAARYANYIPEPLRLKHSGLNTDQLRVYQDFARVRTMAVEQAAQEEPGTGRDMQAQLPQGLHGAGIQLTPQFLNERFSQLLADAERARNKIVYPLLSNQADGELATLVRSFLQIFSGADVNREEITNYVAQRSLLAMFERPPAANDPVVILLGFLLDRLTDSGKRLSREITLATLRLLEEGKHNWVAVVALIKAHLVSIIDIIKLFVSRPTNPEAQPISSDFVGRVILKVFVQDEMEAPPLDPETVAAIEYYAYAVRNNRGGPLSDEVARAFASNPTSRNVALPLVRMFEVNSMPQANEADAVAQGQASPLSYGEWLRFISDPMNGEISVNNFLRARLHTPLSDEALVALLRSGLDKSFGEFFATGNPVPTYPYADAFSRLCVLLVRHYVDGQAQPATPRPAGRIPILDKILAVIVLYASNLAMQKKVFPQRTLARIFSSLLYEFNAPHRVLDGCQMDIMLAVSEALYALRASACPGWTFSWLELVSHRMFMPKILSKQRGWASFQRLIVDLFKVMAPFLRKPELNDQLRHLYRGTLHVMLVLLHDFPEFLCEHHFSLCDPLPPTAVHLRNLVLSAFPRNMRLPDPFTPNLKVDLLPDINTPPRISPAFQDALNASNLRSLLDSFLRTRDPSLLADLRGKLTLPAAEAQEQGTPHNVPLINALVLYVGAQAIGQLQSKTPISHSPSMDIFLHLMFDLDPEGRYHLLNAIANQLRFPNSHTHFFSCVLLVLFSDVNSEPIQEQITRVLLERLIVNRPHPWGLLITFIELIKNARYNFWSHEFTRCAPEIEWLFDSVAKSCMVPMQNPAAEQQQQPPQQQ